MNFPPLSLNVVVIADPRLKSLRAGSDGLLHGQERLGPAGRGAGAAGHNLGDTRSFDISPDGFRVRNFSFPVGFLGTGTQISDAGDRVSAK